MKYKLGKPLTFKPDTHLTDRFHGITEKGQFTIDSPAFGQDYRGHNLQDVISFAHNAHDTNLYNDVHTFIQDQPGPDFVRKFNRILPEHNFSGLPAQYMMDHHNEPGVPLKEFAKKVGEVYKHELLDSLDNKDLGPIKDELLDKNESDTKLREEIKNALEESPTWFADFYEDRLNHPEKYSGSIFNEEKEHNLRHDYVKYLVNNYPLVKHMPVISYLLTGH